MAAGRVGIAPERSARRPALPQRLRAVDDAQHTARSRQRGDLANRHAAGPVVVITWLTLMTRVCGVNAAAKRSTMRPGSGSVVAIFFPLDCHAVSPRDVAPPQAAAVVFLIGRQHAIPGHPADPGRHAVHRLGGAARDEQLIAGAAE